MYQINLKRNLQKYYIYIYIHIYIYRATCRRCQESGFQMKVQVSHHVSELACELEVPVTVLLVVVVGTPCRLRVMITTRAEVAWEPPATGILASWTQDVTYKFPAAASHWHSDGGSIWNPDTSDKSDVKSISKYIQVYDCIYFIYWHILVYTSISK